MIGDLQPHQGAARARFARQADLNLLARPAVFDGVFDQIGHDLHHLIGIDKDHLFAVQPAGLQVNPGRLGQGTQTLQRQADQGGQIMPGRRALTFLRLDPAQMQQVLHQPVHPPGLGRHGGQKTVARRRILPRRAAQGFDEAQQRGQGRAQFMADIGHEIAPHLFGLFLFADVLKQAHRTLPEGRDRDAVDDLMAWPRQDLPHGALLFAGDGPRDGLQNLGLAQGKAVMPPDDAAAQERQRRLIRAGDARIRCNQQRRQRQAGKQVGKLVGKLIGGLIGHGPTFIAGADQIGRPCRPD